MLKLILKNDKYNIESYVLDLFKRKFKIRYVMYLYHTY